jgi:hypothetical protein
MRRLQAPLRTLHVRRVAVATATRLTFDSDSLRGSGTKPNRLRQCAGSVGTVIALSYRRALLRLNPVWHQMVLDRGAEIVRH